VHHPCASHSCLGRLFSLILRLDLALGPVVSLAKTAKPKVPGSRSPWLKGGHNPHGFWSVSSDESNQRRGACPCSRTYSVPNCTRDAGNNFSSPGVKIPVFITFSFTHWLLFVIASCGHSVVFYLYHGACQKLDSSDCSSCSGSPKENRRSNEVCHLTAGYDPCERQCWGIVGLFCRFQ